MPFFEVIAVFAQVLLRPGMGVLFGAIAAEAADWIRNYDARLRLALSGSDSNR